MLVFFDDILIYSQDRDTDLQHIRLVLKIFEDNKSHTKLSKCEFATQNIDYLGHVISMDGISVDRSKLQDVQESRLAQNSKAIKRFFEVAGGIL